MNDIIGRNIRYSKSGRARGGSLGEWGCSEEKKKKKIRKFRNLLYFPIIGK